MFCDDVCNKYYSDSGGKPEIQKIVDKCIKGFGGISDSDIHDFYSVANEVFVKTSREFIPDKGQSFKTYLTLCIGNKCKELMTQRNAYKRIAQRNCVSIDTPINGEDVEDLTIGDMVSNGKSVEDDYFDGMLSDQTIAYLDGLNKKQKTIALYIMRGNTEKEILEIMRIGYKEYEALWKDMTSYEKTEVLM